MVFSWLDLALKKKPTGVTGIHDHSGKLKTHGDLIGAKEWFFIFQFVNIHRIIYESLVMTLT